MNKNQFSRGAHASALSTHNRLFFSARFFLPAFFLALIVMSHQPETSAKAAEVPLPEVKASLTNQQFRASAPNCSACEQALVQCLASGGGGSCYDRYDDCIENCLSNHMTGSLRGKFAEYRPCASLPNCQADCLPVLMVRGMRGGIYQNRFLSEAAFR